MNHQYEPIADGLATQGYAVFDDFLTPSAVDNILGLESVWLNLNNFKKAGIGKNKSLQINESIRGDYIQWVDKSSAAPSLTLYLEKLQQLAGYLNQGLYLSIKDHEVHLTVYPEGAFYKRHLDQFKNGDHRLLSVICYLNKQWTDADGGQLRLYTKNGSVDVLPVAGRLVCFRSDQLEHEVLPSTRSRLSLTGWMLDQYKDVMM